MSYDSAVKSPRTIRDASGNPLTLTAGQPEIDVSGLPSTSFKRLAFDLTTLTDNAGGTHCLALLKTFPGGKTSAGFYYIESLSTHSKAVTNTAAANLLLKIMLRDATLLPTPTIADMDGATAIESITQALSVGVDVYANGEDNDSDNPGITDSYGNTIVPGDDIVFDLVLYVDQPKADQSGPVDILAVIALQVG